jgi:hypothetical protein
LQAEKHGALQAAEYCRTKPFRRGLGNSISGCHQLQPRTPATNFARLDRTDSVRHSILGLAAHAEITAGKLRHAGTGMSPAPAYQPGELASEMRRLPQPHVGCDSVFAFSTPRPGKRPATFHHDCLRQSELNIETRTSAAGAQFAGVNPPGNLLKLTEVASTESGRLGLDCSRSRSSRLFGFGRTSKTSGSLDTTADLNRSVKYLAEAIGCTRRKSRRA